MPNAVINVLVKGTTKPITGEQADNLLTRIENTIADACKEYGVGEPTWITAQFDDWMTRPVHRKQK